MAIPVLLSKKLTSIFNRILVFLAVFDNIFIFFSVLEGERTLAGSLRATIRTVPAYKNSPKLRRFIKFYRPCYERKNRQIEKTSVPPIRQPGFITLSLSLIRRNGHEVRASQLNILHRNTIRRLFVEGYNNEGTVGTGESRGEALDLEDS